MGSIQDLPAYERKPIFNSRSPARSALRANCSKNNDLNHRVVASHTCRNPLIRRSVSLIRPQMICEVIKNGSPYESRYYHGRQLTSVFPSCMNHQRTPRATKQRYRFTDKVRNAKTDVQHSPTCSPKKDC